MSLVDFTPDRMGMLASCGVLLSDVHGTIDVASEALFEPPVSIDAKISFYLPFEIGAFSHLNGGFLRNVRIGRYCSFARDVQIGHGAHPVNWISVSPLQYVSNYRGWGDFLKRRGTPVFDNIFPFDHATPTTIGNDVWIGNNVFIKDGLNIGDGSIIGAGSVVTKDVPPYVIVAGNPSRIIRQRFSDGHIEKLLDLRWWRYALPNIPAIAFNDPDRAIDRFSALIEERSLQEYQPDMICVPGIFSEIDKSHSSG